MFKFTAVVFFVAVVYFAAAKLDIGEEPAYAAHERLARATCDLLSASAAGISVNHAACAAHCLVMGRGFKGGRCIDGICHCRK